MLFKVVLRSDPGQGRADNPTADTEVSLGMVPECPKWLDLKQIPGAAWEEAQSISFICVHISLGASWDPLCPWWTSQPYSVMSPIPLWPSAQSLASRLWNSPHCRDYQGIRRILAAAKDSSAFCKIYSVSGTSTLCFAQAVSQQAVNAVWRSELLSQQGCFSLLPSDCPHQPHLSPAALPAASCRAGSLKALLLSLPEQSSSPELLSKASLWSQAKSSCCKGCYFPSYENIWQDGYRKEWHLWNVLYFSCFQNKQKTPYCPFLPHLTGKTALTLFSYLPCLLN